MNIKDIKQIKTVAEALIIIKELQAICREQRDEIKGLKYLIEIGSNESKSESAVNLIAKHLFKKGR
jgi:hypothetical protein